MGEKHEEFVKAAMQGMLSNPHWTATIEELDEEIQLEFLYQQSITIADYFMERMSLQDTDKIQQKMQIRSMRNTDG